MKKYKWLYISGIYLFLCLMDGFLTYMNTPDLSQEGNPLVSRLGLGWGALFLANAVGFAFFVLLAYTGWSYERETFEVTGVFDFYMKLLYGDGYRRAWFWYRWPKRQRPFWAWCAYTVCGGVIAGRAVLVAEWLATTINVNIAWWWRLRRTVPMHRMDVWIGILVAFILYIDWLYAGYRCCTKISS